jgi:hypothetical protein
MDKPAQESEVIRVLRIDYQSQATFLNVIEQVREIVLDKSRTIIGFGAFESVH